MAQEAPSITMPQRSSNVFGGSPQSPGYASNLFEGKKEQLDKVRQHIKTLGFLPDNLINQEVSWFYNNLGIDDMYFMTESVKSIAHHIMALYGAKIFAYTKSETTLDINLQRETETGATYIHSSRPGVSMAHGPQVEQKIDRLYLDTSTPKLAFRVETYRSTGTVSTNMSTQLRCYFISKCNFVEVDESDPVTRACQSKSILTEKDVENLDITKYSDKVFLEKATENTLDIYQDIMISVLQRTGPVIEMVEMEGSREKRLVIGYRQGTTSSFFSAMSDLYHFYDLYSTRKYVEQFSNGVTIMSFYLNPMPLGSVRNRAPPIESSIFQVIKEASLIYCLPTTPFQDFFQAGTLSVQEAIYGYVGWIFCQHFLNRLGHEYSTLSNLLATEPKGQEILMRIKKRLRSETFTREYILELIKGHPGLLKLLYINFATAHYVGHSESVGMDLQPSLSYQRIKEVEAVLSDDDLWAKIRSSVSNNHELMVFECFLAFNKHVLKTNFYQPTKVALSFRLDARFLPEIEYRTKPFGIILVVGGEFRGFHIRFRDIARGGIRMIRSRNREAYSINLRSLFDENYGLALTQQRKNKDIPEGGSKGTILLNPQSQDRSLQAFEKYIDSILDLLIPGYTPGIKERIVDLYGKPEILFFGPDEGTAEFMDWASSHASKRGYFFWKAITTGKSQALGGIPHDTYGMTTRSIHQYVLGIYRKLGLREEECTKVQTGGPDGDLGSNEIKISRDKTRAVVDGSGVVWDPEGLDREELLRLANARLMITHFDVKKLSPKGFRVLVDENSVTLPDGTVVDSGLQFRNTFHLRPEYSALIFVPCGGRPESVDINNVESLLTEKVVEEKKGGKTVKSTKLVPKFQYIVEGANLFFTQEARLRLERLGALIFKDASANKGGVTSSSLEVLAALACTDEEFFEHMQVKPAVSGQEESLVPIFYREYVEQVQATIEENARLEFECLWRESIKFSACKSQLSDQISTAILDLNSELQTSPLWENRTLRMAILKDYFPSLLREKIGLERMVARLPEEYLKAVFGCYLASRFVYAYGLKPSQFAFFEFLSHYLPYSMTKTPQHGQANREEEMESKKKGAM